MVDLYLADVNGNVIEIVIKNQSLPNEKYAFNLTNIRQLPEGFYFLVFKINGKIISKNSVVKKIH